VGRPLRLFDPVPGFTVDSTHGPIDFHAWREGGWALLLACPFDFTPVCTTELAALARRSDEFTARGVRLAVTSADDVATHRAWVADVERVFDVEVGFPLLADADRVVADRLGMLDLDDPALMPVRPGRWLRQNPEFAVRTLFVVRPSGSLALSTNYPPGIGLSTDELLRVLDGLQFGSRKLAVPADWQQGDDVVVGRVLPDDVARARHGELTELTPYLRTVRQPPHTLR
jgi:alkyl hydroperoxide reductase subunit AhpC